MEGFKERGASLVERAASVKERGASMLGSFKSRAEDAYDEA